MAKRGFQAIKKQQVAKIKARGNRTAGGKKIRNPEAYVAGGLRKTGIKKYGAAGFKAKQRAAR